MARPLTGTPVGHASFGGVGVDLPGFSWDQDTAMLDIALALGDGGLFLLVRRLDRDRL